MPSFCYDYRREKYLLYAGTTNNDNSVALKKKKKIYRILNKSIDRAWFRLIVYLLRPSNIIDQCLTALDKNWRNILQTNCSGPRLISSVIRKGKEQTPLFNSLCKQYPRKIGMHKNTVTHWEISVMKLPLSDLNIPPLAGRKRCEIEMCKHSPFNLIVLILLDCSTKVNPRKFAFTPSPKFKKFL